MVKESIATFVIKDDFFKPDLSNLIAQGIEAYQWRYWHSVPGANNKSFVCFLWTESTGENFFRLLWKMVQREFLSLHDYDCFRIFANGQVRGQNINWHKDYGDKTAVYFPTSWERDWGGSTYFQIGDSKKEVQYKQNRLVLFDTDIWHSGSGPTVDNIMRVSIVFNLRSARSVESKSSPGRGAATRNAPEVGETTSPRFLNSLATRS
jgi:hypothetical protein